MSKQITNEKCPICGKTPTVKTGQYGSFYSCGKNQTGQWCQYSWKKAGFEPTATQEYHAEVKQQDKVAKEDKKNDTITRLAIAKSIIESGMKFDEGGLLESEKWLKWALSGEAGSELPF